MLLGSGTDLVDEWLDMAAQGWSLRAAQESCDDRGAGAA